MSGILFFFLLFAALMGQFLGGRNAIIDHHPTFAKVLASLSLTIGIVLAIFFLYLVYQSSQIGNNYFSSSSNLANKDYYSSTADSVLLWGVVFAFLTFYFVTFRWSVGQTGTKIRKFCGYVFLFLLLPSGVYSAVKMLYIQGDPMGIIVVLVLFGLPSFFLCKTYKYERDELMQLKYGSNNIQVTNTQPLGTVPPGQGADSPPIFKNDWDKYVNNQNVNNQNVNNQNYPDNWIKTASRGFTQEEIDLVQSATVVPSQYGKSVCFFLRTGMRSYIPVSALSTLKEGESVDISKVQLITLSRQGDADKFRVE